MRLASITAGLAKMESKLTGSNSGYSADTTSSTVSMNHDLIDHPKFGRGSSLEPTAMLVARLISRTLLLMTVIVCSLLLLSIYIQSKWTNNCGTEYSSQTSRHNSYFEPMTAAAETDIDDNSSSPLKKHIPISIRMNGRAGDLMSIGQGEKGQVNCLIERKIANQIIASEPKKLMTPFGNITTDPRLIHLTGEKLIFSCNSGDKEPVSDGQDDKMDQDKHIKRLIIISNFKDSIDSNKSDKDTLTLPKLTNSGMTPLTARESRQVPLINNRRNKRQVEDSIKHQKKECACKCAC